MISCRTETRRNRYDKKSCNAIQMPVSFVAINFDFDDNLAFLIRTAACYGAKAVYVIGSVPPRNFLNPKSGSLYDYIEISSFKTPSHFLDYSRKNNISIVSAELAEGSINLFEYSFNFDSETAIVLGHETIGVPTEIIYNSQPIYIPMNGPGFCLNTSQTGTAIMTEYTRQYMRK